ncbi:hypothetical protein HK099_003710 [Clydaea vesicula]|uniref:Man1/Src1 C-terminal domain-containing protein n=1 Tax=Clydaea vesicula TaxID=447962 RepID=A0AAD5U1H0_9FUNG|nr:hypothetical protein HK099_003710 [Clydaea vesicula]
MFDACHLVVLTTKPEYLEDDFDPNKLKIRELISILSRYDIDLPSTLKKKQFYVDLFNNELKTRIDQLQYQPYLRREETTIEYVGFTEREESSNPDGRNVFEESCSESSVQDEEQEDTCNNNLRNYFRRSPEIRLNVFDGRDSPRGVQGKVKAAQNTFENLAKLEREKVAKEYKKYLQQNLQDDYNNSPEFFTARDESLSKFDEKIIDELILEYLNKEVENNPDPSDETYNADYFSLQKGGETPQFFIEEDVSTNEEERIYTTIQPDNNYGINAVSWNHFYISLIVLALAFTSFAIFERHYHSLRFCADDRYVGCIRCPAHSICSEKYVLNCEENYSFSNNHFNNIIFYSGWPVLNSLQTTCVQKLKPTKVTVELNNLTNQNENEDYTLVRNITTPPKKFEGAATNTSFNDLMFSIKNRIADSIVFFFKDHRETLWVSFDFIKVHISSLLREKGTSRIGTEDDEGGFIKISDLKDEIFNDSNFDSYFNKKVWSNIVQNIRNSGVVVEKRTEAKDEDVLMWRFIEADGN